jgi:phosphatidylserine/phosphatidylglycerophosphate/cardiolipin synthase-like enzyme
LTSLQAIFDKDRQGEKIHLSDIHPNLVICNINCRTVIEQILRDAKESIIIQTQYITDSNIMNILNSKTSLDKRIIVADTESNLPLIRDLKTGMVKRLKKYYNHTKMILVDKKILLLGSMNLSSTSLDKNREI